ncbi:MAG: UPF0175 family protein [Bacteroidota bacterium]
MTTYQLPSTLNIKDFDLKMMIAVKLFEEGRLSTGQAAQIVGISKRTFTELLGTYGVSLFGYDFEEMEEDLVNV